MRVLNTKEQQRVSGGYLYDDTDVAFWMYVNGLPPPEREQFINASIFIHSLGFFAIFGALGSMAAVTLISESTAILAGSGVAGTLVGGSIGYSFAKYVLSS